MSVQILKYLSAYLGRFERISRFDLTMGLQSCPPTRASEKLKYQAKQNPPNMFLTPMGFSGTARPSAVREKSSVV